MAKRIIGTTPKQDGYRMPAEFEPQQGVWMLWPERNDNWRDGGTGEVFLPRKHEKIVKRMEIHGNAPFTAVSCRIYQF